MTKVRLVTLVALLLAVALPAGAATPATGSVTKAKRTVKWSGGPFTVSDPVDPVGLGVPPPPDCHTSSSCDHFALRITLGDKARVEVKVTTAKPNPADGLQQPITGDDYDLYVYDPTGKLVSGDQGVTVKGNERVTFTHLKKFNGKAYDVAVRPWAVMPGSTYSGVANVVTVGR